VDGQEEDYGSTTVGKPGTLLAFSGAIRPSSYCGADLRVAKKATRERLPQSLIQWACKKEKSV
jgi:hypothetical protein